MLEFIFGSVIFSLGFAAGSWFKHMLWENEDWKLVRWDENIMGYRNVPTGFKLRRNEKVFMCLKVDTEGIPEGGIVNEL